MRLVIVLALLLGTLGAAAQPAPGNLPPDFYPQPNCEKPQSPGKPPEAQNAAAMQSYNVPMLWSSILVVSLLSLVAYGLFAVLGRVLFPWHESVSNAGES